jgi:hypothetical protein
VDVGGSPLVGDLHQFIAERDDVGFQMFKFVWFAIFSRESGHQAAELAALVFNFCDRHDGRVGGGQLEAGNVGGDGPLGLVGPADAMRRHQITGGGPLAELFEIEWPVGLAIADFEVPLVHESREPGAKSVYMGASPSHVSTSK